MRVDILTLLPELFEPMLRLGVTRRAFQGGSMAVKLWPLRDFGEGAYRRLDDRPFGGGPGMVMLAEPLERALAAVRNEAGAQARVIHFTPTGAPLRQARVAELLDSGGLILLCGRYEGIDQRFLDRHVHEELSLGDFVLSGAEIAAMALLDAMARLQDGVLQDPLSHQQDSFSADGLLDCPHYSRPERLADEYGGAVVPPVLLSGHHQQIARWRRERALELTLRRRPELVAAARACGRLSLQDEQFLLQLEGR